MYRVTAVFSEIRPMRCFGKQQAALVILLPRLLEGERRRPPGRLARGHRGAGELRFDGVDPLPAALAQLVVVGSHSPARDQDAEVRALVAVLAWGGDAQVERLGLVDQPVPVVGP